MSTQKNRTLVDFLFFRWQSFPLILQKKKMKMLYLWRKKKRIERKKKSWTSGKITCRVVKEEKEVHKNHIFKKGHTRITPNKKINFWIRGNWFWRIEVQVWIESRVEWWGMWVRKYFWQKILHEVDLCKIFYVIAY